MRTIIHDFDKAWPSLVLRHRDVRQANWAEGGGIDGVAVTRFSLASCWMRLLELGCGARKVLVAGVPAQCQHGALLGIPACRWHGMARCLLCLLCIKPSTIAG